MVSGHIKARVGRMAGGLRCERPFPLEFDIVNQVVVVRKAPKLLFKLKFLVKMAASWSASVVNASELLIAAGRKHFRPLVRTVV